MAVTVTPRADGTWSWAGALESLDPQAVRQAVKTLVAGGDLQRNFPVWALDGDTPLIYQDRPDGYGGVRAQLTVGPTTVHLGYGLDRVAVAAGAGAVEALRRWERDPQAPASWVREVPPDASGVAVGQVDGLGARGSVRVLSDGNLELAVWVDRPGLMAWEQRFRQAPWEWLPGLAGSTKKPQ